jgi:hypothetical protein
MNKEQMDKLLLAIRSGTDLETSCHYAGLSVPAVYRELEIGKTEAEKIGAGGKPAKTKEPALKLWEQLKIARAESIVRNLAVIQSAASAGDWRSAAWFVERAHPEKYSKEIVDKQASKAIDLRHEITKG